MLTFVPPFGISDSGRASKIPSMIQGDVAITPPPMAPFVSERRSSPRQEDSQEIKVAFVTTYDPLDIRCWSGLGFYILKSLQSAGFDTDPLGPLPECCIGRTCLRAKALLYNKVLRGSFGAFSSERDLGIAKFRADVVDKKLNTRRYDLVLSPGALPVALLNSKLPLVIWADATFHALTSTYRADTRMTRNYYRQGELLEHRALHSARLCIFSSEWAARSAVEHYQVDRRKVRVIPFGANLDQESFEGHARGFMDPDGTTRLLFIGIDFYRKGGPKVLDVLRELIASGIDAKLQIVGSDPSVPTELREHVRVSGFLNKSEPRSKELIDTALRSAHWLLLLSQAECFGLALCEANAYGVPCIANQVGGIPTIIRDGLNGKLFSREASASNIARYIASVPPNSRTYTQMAAAAREEYRSRLNWTTAGVAVAQAIREIIA